MTDAEPTLDVAGVPYTVEDVRRLECRLVELEDEVRRLRAASSGGHAAATAGRAVHIAPHDFRTS